jgi:hypothetical protein
LAILATAVTALMTVAIRRSRDVEMLPVAGLSTILSRGRYCLHFGHDRTCFPVLNSLLRLYDTEGSVIRFTSHNCPK